MEAGTTATTLTAKLLILNPEKYDLWLMRIEQYFLMTEYSLWEVIKNGNKVLTKMVGTVKQPYEPTIVEEKLDRKNEMKTRGTLLMALTNKDKLKFHSYQDAKLFMEAIEKSTSSTNEADNTAYGVSTAHIQEEMDLNEEMAMLTIRARRFIKRTCRNLDIIGQKISFNRSKVECFNCHKNRHFARECRALKNQENRGREYGRKTVPVENPTKNALIAQDGIGGHDWSYQAEEEHPTNFALMALTSSGSSSNLDSEVDSCSKTCLKAYATLKEQYDSLSLDYKKSQYNLVSYKAGLQSVEERLVHYKKNEAVFTEKINILNLEVKLRDNALDVYTKNLKKAEKDRDELKLTLKKYQNSSKSLNTLLESQVSDKDKTRLGYKAASPAIENFVNSSKMIENQENVRSRSDKRYHVVLPPYTGNYITPKPDLMFIDEQVESESVDVVSTVSSSAIKTVELKVMSVDVKNKVVCSTTETKPVRIVKPVWNNSRRVNHKNFTNKMTHLHPKRRFVPEIILTKSGKLKIAGTPVNTFRPVNTADSKLIINYSRPTSNAFKKDIHKPKGLSTSIQHTRNIFLMERLMMLRPQHAGFGKPNTNEYKEKRVIDCGCSRHMTGNKCYLTEYEDYDGRFVYFGDGFQTNGIAGTKDNIIVGQAEKKKEPEQEYILIPICTTDPLIFQGSKDSAVDAKKKATKVDASQVLDNSEQDTRSEFEGLLQQERGQIDKTLFIKRHKDDIILVQVYVNDVIFSFSTVKTTSTPMEPKKALVKDAEAEDVDVHLYRSMIGSLIDYAGASLDRKSTTGDYVAATSCCGQVLWIQNQMLDYGFNLMNTKIYIDNESTIYIVKNPVFHSKTKHIEIRHHFIRDSYEKKLIQAYLISKSGSQFKMMIEKDGRCFMDIFVVKTGISLLNTAWQRAEEIKNKPLTKAQQRSLMCTYMRNKKGFKQKDFKGKSFDDIKKIFDKVYKRVDSFVDMDTENVEESLKKTKAKGSSKRAGQELEQESTKKQKMAEQEQDKVADDDTVELKRCLEIVPEDDDVAIEATPISSKSPTIVDYKIYREGMKSYFKIIRADGNSQNYLTFGTLFKNFNREDL
uniref:Putative ribonuclease H-like domain-containing protein n=1 Tax=Tanacetum cinerariifolium TaxID=118510 RepID=A0A6L2KFU1_TANCI|nr:putative ribonuclease H-like domain-containing protein [Tanacetum cinerariifolium]